MAITLDTLSKRYGKLPSEILRDATTLDLMVLDVAISYENYKVRRSRGGAPEYDPDELLKAVEQYKG